MWKEILSAFGLGGFGGYFLRGVIDSRLQRADKTWERKQDEIEKFKAKVVDVIAISTYKGYSNRQNRAEKRRMARAAAQLERLGEKQLAKDIRSYMWKWAEVYRITQGPNFAGGKSPFRKEEKRRLGLVKELDELTNRILNPKKGKRIFQFIIELTKFKKKNK